MRHRFFSLPLFALICLYSTAGLADCVLLKDADKAEPFYQTGDCSKRATAASTFKIPLAIMGYDAGILKSPDEPEWDYKPGYPDWIEAWKGPQTPKSWMRYSVVWYSQLLTNQLGTANVTAYLKKFSYGNEDISDQKGEKGLERAWLNGTLKISPLEQSRFVSRVATGAFSATPQEQSFLETILRLDETVDGWTLYGKTGATGYNKTPIDGQPHRIGWFVGWMEKNGRKIVFVNYGEQLSPNKDVTGVLLRAKFVAELPEFIAKIPE